MFVFLSLFSHCLYERSFNGSVVVMAKKKVKTTRQIAIELTSTVHILENPALRTVPTKYGGFCAKLAPCGKSRSLQKPLESKKKNGGSHAFCKIISLES